MTAEQRRAAVRAAVAAAIRSGAASGRVVVVVRETRTDYASSFKAINRPREGRSGA